MTIGLVGRKCGMTRTFGADGAAIPVTVVEVLANRVIQVKTPERDGYSAVQVTTGERAPGRVSGGLAGHFSKAEVAPGRGLWEFRVEDGAEYQPGQELGMGQFEAGQKVDVTATSKGKGFAGAVKRWNFRTQDMSHGNSVSHRAPGSIGQCQTPGRVFKGKKMAGQLGNKQVTVQSLEIVRADAEKGVLLIKGGVPGAAGADVVITAAVKG